MKKKWLILGTVCLALSVCAGCGDWVARMKENWEMADSEAFSQAETETWQEMPSADSITEGTIPVDDTLPAETVPETEGTLLPEELAVFESFLNDVANNGFLCCTYEDVRQADLNEILYNGAGLEQQPLTDELRQAYETQAGEIFTDTIRLTTAQIDGFLLEKTGYGFSDFQPPSWWTYLEEYDIWMTQHGDTNMSGVVCDSGLRSADGMVTLSCHIPGFGDGARDSVLTVTLRETENGYQFVKNETDVDVLSEETLAAENSGQPEASL